MTTTASGAFTVPTGVRLLQIEVWGGGGGGAYAKKSGISVTPGQSISYTVGAGGLAEEVVLSALQPEMVLMGKQQLLFT